MLEDLWIVKAAFDEKWLDQQQMQNIKDIKKNTTKSFEEILLESFLSKNQLQIIKSKRKKTQNNLKETIPIDVSSLLKKKKTAKTKRVEASLLPHKENIGIEKLKLKQFSSYQIIKKIGVGNFGNVFLVLDKLGKKLALKILQVHLQQDEVAVKRFRRESLNTISAKSPRNCKSTRYRHVPKTKLLYNGLYRWYATRYLLAKSKSLYCRSRITF